MDRNTLVVTVFCLLDDWLASRSWRRRGPRPTLHDSEVVTMVVVGEYLGLDTDTGIYHYFRDHYGTWFPGLRHVHRTTFARQAANLWAVFQQAHVEILRWLACDPALSIIDSFPLPLCRFARAYRCRRLRGTAAYGYDDVARQRYYGLRGHVRVGWPGVLVTTSVAPANVHDRWVAEADLLPGARGVVLGDTNYWSPQLQADLTAQGVTLLAPRKTNQRRRHPWPAWLTHRRRRADTVIGQLVERYHAKRVWARDAWHLTARWGRKVLSHTLCVYLCARQGLSPLRLAQLVTE